MPTDVLRADAIRLGRTAADMLDAIDQCGQLLVEIGAVEQEYLAGMRERERAVSTFVGRGVALPHGTDESRRHVRSTTLAVLQFPDGVDWHGDTVTVCVAIAATTGEEHIGLISRLAQLLLDEGRVERLRTATDVDTVLALLTLDEPQPADETRPKRSRTAPTVRRPDTPPRGHPSRLTPG